LQSRCVARMQCNAICKSIIMVDGGSLRKSDLVLSRRWCADAGPAAFFLCSLSGFRAGCRCSLWEGASLARHRRLAPVPRRRVSIPRTSRAPGPRARADHFLVQCRPNEAHNMVFTLLQLRRIWSLPGRGRRRSPGREKGSGHVRRSAPTEQGGPGPAAPAAPDRTAGPASGPTYQPACLAPVDSHGFLGNSSAPLSLAFPLGIILRSSHLMVRGHSSSCRQTRRNGSNGATRKGKPLLFSTEGYHVLTHGEERTHARQPIRHPPPCGG